jgi:hypothetical protein
VHHSSLAVFAAVSSGRKEKNGEENDKFLPCEVFLFILANNFLHAVKSYGMGPTALLPSEGRCTAEFYRS